MSNHSDPFIPKIFNLLRLLHMKNGFVMPGPPMNDTIKYPHEFWLYKIDDPHYQLIRITTNKASDSIHDENRIMQKHDYISKKFGITPKFLDIHISDEEYDPGYEKYDYANIDYNFHNGVDVEQFYPGIYSTIDRENEINNLQYMIRQGAKIKKEAIREQKNFKTIPITLSLIIICSIIYIIELALTARYSDASAYIILGAEYKTFTLGLRQYYRLFTNALLHGSFLHLVSNMVSLYFVGSNAERITGKARFALLIFVSVLVASLTQGIMTENSLLLGMSGGIYGAFVYLMIAIILSGRADFSSFLPTILINIYLNFLSKTAWLAHLGGAVAGMVMFMVYNRKDKKGPIALLAVLIVFMVYRYLSLKTINPFYQATDMEVANIYYEWGLKDYSVKLIARLLEVYKKFGG